MGIPPPIEQANLGMADSLILMVLALVVFGPRRLPQIGRQIGKLMYEFRKASNDFKFQMEEELRNSEEADRRKREEAERQRTLALNAPAQVPAIEAPAPQSPSEANERSEDAPAASEIPYSPESSHGDFVGQEAPAEDSYPRIQPPSTGETVAASRPGSAAVEKTEAQSAPPAAEKAPAEREAAAGESGAVTEQTAHNG
jgi:sec-independent protein translocase protein TatB